MTATSADKQVTCCRSDEESCQKHVLPAARAPGTRLVAATALLVVEDYRSAFKPEAKRASDWGPRLSLRATLLRPSLLFGAHVGLKERPPLDKDSTRAAVRPHQSPKPSIVARYLRHHGPRLPGVAPKSRSCCTQHRVQFPSACSRVMRQLPQHMSSPLSLLACH